MQNLLSPVGGSKQKGLPGFLRASMGVSPSTGRMFGPNLPRLESGPWEEATTNLLAGKTDFNITGNSGTGWSGYSGSVPVRTTNQSDPSGGTTAFRIQTTGGTSTLKFFALANRSYVAGETFSHKVWVKKAAGSPDVQVRGNVLGSTKFSVTVTSTSWIEVELYGTATGPGSLMLAFDAPSAGDSLDFYVWHPLIKEGSPALYTPTSRPAIYNSGALMIEEQATNGALNPLFGAAPSSGVWPTSWSLDWNAVSQPTKEVYLDGNRWTLKITSTGDAKNGTQQTVGVWNSATATWAVNVRCNRSIIVELVIYDNTTAMTKTSATWVIGTSMTRIVLPYGTFVSGNAIGIYIRTVNAVAGDWMEVSEPQLEARAHPTSFTPVTRAAETFQIPTAGILSPTQGAIGFWAYIDAVVKRQVPGGWNRLLNIPSASGASPWLGIDLVHHPAASSWQLYTGDGSTSKTSSCLDSLTPDGLRAFVISWSAASAQVYIDGVPRITIANPIMPAAFAAFGTLGSYGANGYANTRYAALWATMDLPTDAQIAALYASGEPFPTAWNLTYRNDFRRRGSGLIVP